MHKPHYSISTHRAYANPKTPLPSYHNQRNSISILPKLLTNPVVLGKANIPKQAIPNKLSFYSDYIHTANIKFKPYGNISQIVNRIMLSHNTKSKKVHKAKNKHKRAISQLMGEHYLLMKRQSHLLSRIENRKNYNLIETYAA